MKKKALSLYGVHIVKNKSVPKDESYIANSVEIIETWDNSGSLLLEVELRDTNGKSIPAPKFISEYKERVRNFGKIFTVWDDSIKT